MRHSVVDVYKSLVKQHTRTDPRTGRMSVVREYQDSRTKAVHPTETPEFKRWFAGSKVVDEQGKPLVVYHGGSERVKNFSRGSVRGSMGPAYFTSEKEIAIKYAVAGGIDPRLEQPGYDVGDYVGKIRRAGKYRKTFLSRVYLKIENPIHPDEIDGNYVISVLGKDAVINAVKHDSSLYNMEESGEIEDIETHLKEDNKLIDYLDDEYSKEDILLENDHDAIGGPGNTTGGFNFLHLSGLLPVFMRSAGHDGFIFEDKEAGGTTYVPFSPTQIKSATGNSGTFDPDNPDITKALTLRIA